MSKCKIIVRHILPPIPSRNYDYCAYWDGWEEDCEYGWGKDALEAVRDLLENYPLPEDKGETITTFTIDIEGWG